MAMLTKDRDTKIRAGRDYAHPVAAGARIHGGAVICLNAAGFAVPASAAPGLKSPLLAQHAVDNREGADGAQLIFAAREVVGLDCEADVTRSHIGQTVYLADDHTVTAAGAGKSPAGLLIDLGEGQAWVDLAHAQ